MKKDDDVVRGIGYVTIQASHLEGSIEEIAVFLSTAIERPQNNTSDAVSRKIGWCKSAIKQIKNVKLSTLDTQLDEAANLFDKRNKLVHGRIYFDCLLPERLVPTRRKTRERDITPEELYNLGDKIYSLHTRIVSDNAFRLCCTISDHIKN